MADGSAPEDLWHLTIDDLLSSPPEPKPIGGAGPYIINLSASTAPISLPPKGLLEFDQLHAYHVQQRENGQQRFRLRLGPIASELEADVVLGAVREHYPRALIATADEDDLRAIAAAAASNGRKPARPPAPAASNRPPATAPPATVPSAPRVAEPPARTPPAVATESRNRPAPPRAPAPPSAPRPAPLARSDDIVSAKELAEMFLAASEPVATVAPKVAIAPTPKAPQPAPRPLDAESPNEKANPAPPSPAAANAKLTPPSPAPAIVAKVESKPTLPTAPRVEQAKATPSAPAPPPGEQLNAAPRSPTPPPVTNAQAAPPAPALPSVEQANTAPPSPAPPPVTQAASAAPSPHLPSVGREETALLSPPPMLAVEMKAASAVPVLGVEHVATPRSASRHAHATERSPPARLESPALPPTLRTEQPVPPPARDEVSVASVVVARPPLEFPPPPSLLAPVSPPAASPPAAAAADRAPKTPIARLEPPRVSLADFRALAASVSFTTESTPIPRKLAEQPRAAASVLKPESPPAARAEFAVPLSLAPSAPRLPLIDLTLQPAPVSAKSANLPELRKGATSPPPPVGAQPAVARPPDLLAEIAAARPRRDKTPFAAPPPIATPATGGAATAAVKPAPTTTPAATSSFAADRPAAATLRVEASESLTWPLKPVVVNASVAPPAIAATPMAEPSSALAAPQAPAAPVELGLPVKSPVKPEVAGVLSVPPAPAVTTMAALSPVAAAPAAPTVRVESSAAAKPPAVPPAPKVAPADAGEKPRRVAEAPTHPVRPSLFRPATPQKRVRPVEAPPKAHAVPAAAKSAAAPPSSAAPKPVRALDQTQTVQALTSLELADSDSSRLFAIQLAVAESEFRPQEIPNLGIFEEYRLYSTMGLDGDKVLHALRLGFFTDEGAAGAVAGYLRSHFEGAALKRVSTAERDRFAEQRVKAQKDAGATGIHAAIELRSPDLKTTTSLADLTQRASRRRSD